MSTGPSASAAPGAGSHPSPDHHRQHREVMTHREILEALSGLLLVLFVAMLSSTVVSNALPKTIEELKGTQTEYIWVITATLLTATASTPIWGKLADLFSKKVLIQTAIVVFLAGSVVCGLAQSPGQLIAARAFQGLGTGGPLLGGIVFLSQYLQVARGYTPTKAGLITIPLMGGVLTASVIIGQLVRTDQAVHHLLDDHDGCRVRVAVDHRPCDVRRCDRAHLPRQHRGCGLRHHRRRVPPAGDPAQQPRPARPAGRRPAAGRCRPAGAARTPDRRDDRRPTGGREEQRRARRRFGEGAPAASKIHRVGVALHGIVIATVRDLIRAAADRG